MDNFNLKKYLSNNPLLNEIKVNKPAFTNLSRQELERIKIASLPTLDLKIGKYDVSKGRKGKEVDFNDVNAATKDRVLKVFNKLGIAPEKTWFAWYANFDTDLKGRKRAYRNLRSTFVLSHYENEPIIIAQTQTGNEKAGQIYIYSKYFKSGKVLRLPDGKSKLLDNSGLYADGDNTTKEQILNALKIKKYKDLNEIKVRNPLNNQPITITFTPEPFTQEWDPSSFNSWQEWDEFKEKLKFDENFAYKTFFDNTDSKWFDEALEYQNEDNWKIKVK